MIALLLVAVLYAYLSVIGQAVVSLFRPRLGVLWSWFAAPTLGLSLLIVIITRLNVWGIPVRTAGPWTTLALLAGAAAVLAWRRPLLPLRKLIPFRSIWAALGFAASRAFGAAGSFSSGSGRSICAVAVITGVPCMPSATYQRPTHNITTARNIQK